MKKRKPKNLAKKIASVIFCIDNQTSYNDVFSGRYEDLFLLHTGLYTGEALMMISESEKEFVKEFINNHNLIS
jgi:hypothetical protein